MTFILYFDTFLYLGLCEVSPTIGKAVVDKFKINCSDWEDMNTPLKYEYFVIRSGVRQLLCSSLLTECEVPLPLGNEDNKLIIYIEIKDSLSGVTQVNQTVTVSCA